MIPRIVATGLGLALLVLVALAGVDSCRKRQGTQNEQQAQQHIQEAEHHAGAAEALPDHSAALAAAQESVDRARQEVAVLRRRLAAADRPGVPDPTGAPQPPAGPVAPDHRNELLVAQGELIQKQDAQIQGLKLALSDEQKRSEQWRLAYESERKAQAAQQAATEAWKQAVTTSRWRGRVEGFAAGVALGYVARGQR